MHRVLMSAEDNYLKFHSRNRSKFVSAVEELDAYISEDENRFGGIVIFNDDEILPRCQPKIWKSLTELKAALKKDKTEREEAYEYIKKSNKTMKKIMENLKEEMKICRDNIRGEFTNFENLNTERLLSIDPRDFVTSTARGK